MSRRRGTERRGIGGNSFPERGASARERKAVWPADLCARAIVKDPAGHPLVTCGRSYSEPDAGRIWYEADTLSTRTTMFHQADPDNDSRWVRLLFVCRVCRDQAHPVSSWIDVADLAEAIAGLWSADGDTPRTTTIRTTWGDAA